MFITLEGPDGSGKTTAIKPIKEWLESKGYKVLLTREPGGTPISEEIRNVVLRNRDESMDPWTEALLFIAARKQHLDDVVIPAINDGYIVISDRYMDSTSTYQGAARDLGVDKIDEVQNIVLGKWIPDITLYFDVKPEVALTRMDTRESTKNRLDKETDEYKEKVVKGYKDLIKKHPNRFRVIDANKGVQEVEAQVKKVIEEAIENDQR